MRGERLDLIADALSIGRLQRHLFLCAEQSTPRCAPYPQTRAVWRYVKRRLKELDLASAPPAWRTDLNSEPRPQPGEGCVLRTKVDCLRICERGPIALVYPDGTWYHNVTEDVAERIIQEHLIHGREVSEYVFARDSLSP